MKKIVAEDVANAWYKYGCNIARTANALQLSWKTVNRILVAYFDGKAIFTGRMLPLQKEGSKGKTMPKENSLSKALSPAVVAKQWRECDFNINRTARALQVSRQTISTYLQTYFKELRLEKIFVDVKRQVVLIPLEHWKECSAKLFGRS